MLYHSLIFLGSLHLKKMPPIPVTLFGDGWSFVILVMSDLKVKPSPNVATSAKMSSALFFILVKIGVCDLLRLLPGSRKYLRVNVDAIHRGKQDLKHGRSSPFRIIAFPKYLQAT